MCVCRVVDHRRGTCQAKQQTAQHLQCVLPLSLSDTPLAVLCAAAVDSQTYFASPCKFGPGGVKEVLGFGELSSYEKGWFDKMMPELKAQIKKGIEFANA